MQGNDIGTEPGTVFNDEGNGGDGISIETTGEGSGGINNVIGDAPSTTVAAAGNVIAFNGRNGVVIYSDKGAANTGNAILGNSIFENKLLGIDLGNDGVTPNGSHAGRVGAEQLAGHTSHHLGGRHEQCRRDVGRDRRDP